MGELTVLMRRARQGDNEARNAIYNHLYADLRKRARARLARGGRNTLLDTSALVNEAFVRLAGAGGAGTEDRAHFLAYASRAMRSVVVDFARARATQRRGAGVVRISLEPEVADSTPSGAAEILRVHEALEELEQVDERVVRVVEMRYFAGLTEQEVAAALGVTDRTVRRDWEKARLILAATLSAAPTAAPAKP